MRAFEYHRPTDVAAAARLLAEREDAKLLAGGMTLIPTLKQRLAAPSDLVDLGRIAALKGIRREGDALVVGAMTCHADVAASPVVREAIPALASLAGQIGDPAVRHRGTMGGSVANADPAADYPAGVVGLDATVITDRREIAADDFFVGLFETALEPSEIISAIRFRVPRRAAYQKFRHPASGYAVTGIMVADFGGAVRVAVTGAGPSAFRMTAMEEALTGSFAPQALDGLTPDPADLLTDMHASAEYRAHLVGVLARRAVASLV